MAHQIRIKIKTLVTAAVVAAAVIVAIVLALTLSGSGDTNPVPADDSASSTTSSTAAGPTTSSLTKAQLAYNQNVLLSQDIDNCVKIDNGCASNLQKIAANWGVIAAYDTELTSNQTYLSWNKMYYDYRRKGCETAGTSSCSVDLIGMNYSTASVLNNIKMRMGWS